MFVVLSSYLYCGLCVAVVLCAVPTPDLNKAILVTLKGPQSNITEGDNVTFECFSNYFRALYDEFNWTHVSLDHKISVLKNNNETLNIINNCGNTSLECYSYLTIINITNKFNGFINCNHIINKKDIFSSKRKRTLPVNVESSQIPVIQNASSTNATKIIGQSVQWWCFVQGNPPPIVTWFKDGESLILPENDTRVILKDNNQTLLIYSCGLEDVGTYECRASNRIGTAVSINTLNLDDGNIRFPEERRSEQGSFDSIVICSVLTIFLAVLMMLGYVYLKRRMETKMTVFQAGKLHMDNGSVKTWNPNSEIGEKTDLLTLDVQWEFPRDKLILGKELGSGAFGVVFKAEAYDIIDKGSTSTVAVKMIKPDTDPLYAKALATELKIMMNIGQHLNVVNLLGSCVTECPSKQLMVIVEYCRFGSIHQYLLNHRVGFINQVTSDDRLDCNVETISKVPHYENVFNYENHFYENTDAAELDAEDYLVPNNAGPMWRSNYCGDYKHIITKPLCTFDLICWSYQVSKGMEYLASKKILHGDLAARNVLLSDGNVVKICDFGFAKTLYDSETYQKKSKKDRLPVKWMAIESLRDLVFSTQSDIWAFGIVVWEIFALAVTPYPNIRTFNDLYNKLMNGYRMEKPDYANSKIYKIMLDCWNTNPTLRPSFTDLARRLGDLLEHSTKSEYVILNEMYVRMDAGESTLDEYVNHLINPIHPTLNDTNRVSCQINKYENLELINNSENELIVTNSSNTEINEQTL